MDNSAEIKPAALSGRLRPGADIAANMDRICAAAAVMACCDALSLGSALAWSDEVRVGDITLRSSGSSGGGFAGGLRQTLEELRENFLLDISDLLQAPFVFGQISPGELS